MELCDAGSVSDVMTLCDSCLSEDMIATICLNVLQGNLTAALYRIETTMFH